MDQCDIPSHKFEPQRKNSQLSGLKFLQEHQFVFEGTINISQHCLLNLTSIKQDLEHHIISLNPFISQT